MHQAIKEVRVKSVSEGQNLTEVVDRSKSSNHIVEGSYGPVIRVDKRKRSTSSEKGC